MKNRMSRRRRVPLCGFTLVEVAVSIAILGSVIVGLLVARGRSQHAFRVAKEVMICTRLCASRVAALRARLIGEGAGESLNPEGYSWRITRTVLPDGAPDGLQAYEVSVMAPASHADAGSVLVTVWLPRETADQEAARP